MNETTKFTLNLLRAATAKGLKFAVIRGVENENAPPGDADIVSPECVKFRDFIREYCTDNNSIMLPVISRHYVDIYRILAIGQDGQLHTAKIDVHNSEQWRGIVYVHATDAVRDHRIDAGVPRVSHVHSIIGNIMQISLPRGTVTVSRANRIKAALSSLSESDQNELKTYFEGIGLPDTFGYLEKLALDRAAKDIFINRRKIWLKMFLREPSQTIDNLVSTIGRKFKYLIRPPGIFLSIVGPDGAGKTTLISTIVESLRIWTANELIVVQHWRPNFLRPLAALKRYSSSSEPEKSDIEITYSRDRPRQHAVFSSLVRYIYYICDYTLGYWLVSRQLLTKEGIVICDRYVEDYIIAPENRSRVRLPMGLKRIISMIVPRPSHSFYLRGEPSLLYSRKKEEELDELCELVQKYDAYCSQNSGFVILNAAKPVIELKKSILEQLSRGSI